MLDNVIEFSAVENYINLKEDHPIPAKLNIPEWYKKLDNRPDKITIKACMPFLDSLTAGYLLKMPQDLYIKHNIENHNGFPDSFDQWSLRGFKNLMFSTGLNLNTGGEVHPISQLEGSSLVEKNKKLPFYKIHNPWKIKTPKGYSCLFISPMNNSDDRFSIISGIVDTDTYINEINFPFVINGDKYPVLDTVIKKGTPYVQIIPFKRENWKMKITPIKVSTSINNKIFFFLKYWNTYKEKNWIKKSWK